jgi:methylenetetrahydrofolate dehydrogenase (NADP+) / methenyltetrahydrofolate cyclohydrolase
MKMVDGKKMAENLATSLSETVLNFGKKLKLAVVMVGENSVTTKYLESKKKFGKNIGISVRIYKFDKEISTTKLRKAVSDVVHIKENIGVIVQLPLPKQINTQYILDAISPEKDPDMLSSKSVGLFSTGRSQIVPPVVGAIRHIFKEYKIDLQGKSAVVIGAGRLVGIPTAVWLKNQGVIVTTVDEYTSDPERFTKTADIIISGVGKAGIVTSDMIKDDAVVVDAGTSIGGSSDFKSGRELRGDVDSAVANKASLFTPVPGGVGPLTIAMLFSNLIELAKKK